MSEINTELEKISTQKVVLPQDASQLLAEAKQYGVDLDALEQPKEKTAVVENDILLPAEANPFWHSLDIKLGDLHALLMDDSERPIVLISDDIIVYANQAMMQVLDMKNFKHLHGEPFLSFVDKSDWHSLTSNIGEMLTTSKKQKIKLKTKEGKVVPVEFQAIYLPDSTHFSFVLVGRHPSKSRKPFFNNLYDDLTGLPNFFLFEDRVQMAVNNENYKDSRLPKDFIAVLAINIENINEFKNQGLEDTMLKELAETLVFSLKKNYTVARGLRYPFWIMMPDLANKRELDIEISKMQSLFGEGFSNDFSTYELDVKIGVSVFPTPARSAKRLIEQAISALKVAQASKEKMVEYFQK